MIVAWVHPSVVIAISMEINNSPLLPQNIFTASIAAIPLPDACTVSKVEIGNNDN